MTGPSETKPAIPSIDDRLGPIPGFTLPPRNKRWYRRWALWIMVALVVVAVSVVSDLPTGQTNSQQASLMRAVVKEIATGVHPCAYAVNEAYNTFYVPAKNGTMSKTSRGFATQYLNEDQQACSFENTAIFGMSTITVPSSPAGEQLNDVIKTALEWATSDANGAILDIQMLVRHPTDKHVLASLRRREQQLASDRARAERDLRRAQADLHGEELPGLGLPSFPDPAAHSS